MRDETYLFISDSREKKRTARGAYNKRTHAGKGGRVKFPSDYMTKKEVRMMNGEIKSYRLNEPMKWEEFRAMPDDIKAQYIRLLQSRYHASDIAIAKMMGISEMPIRNIRARLGIPSLGKGNRVSEEWESFVSKSGGASGETEVFVNEVKANVENVTLDDELEKISPVKAEAPAEEKSPEVMKTIDECEWLRQENRMLCEENLILRAKLEMVELIFGGRR